MKKTTLLLASVCLALSCSRDKLDLDMADDLRFNPEMEIPLVKSRLSLADLVIKDSNIIIGADDKLSIQFFRDSIFSYQASDLLNIPEQKAVTFPLSPQVIPYDLDFSLGNLNGVELAASKFQQGYLALQLATNTPFLTPVDVEITIKNGDINGSPMKKVISLPTGSTVIKDSLDIAAGIIDFSSGGTNFVGIRVEILNASSVNPQTGMLDLSCRFHSLELESAYGNFGQRFFQIPSGSFDFDISGYNKFMNGFYLTNPKINLIASSTLGIAIDLETDFDGINDHGDLTSLNSPKLAVTGPVTLGNSKTDTLTFDKNNSTIVDFMAALPTNIMYSGGVRMNPQGGNLNNFVHRNSRVDAGIQIILPLELRASNLIMEQTLEGIDFLSDSTNEVTSASLIFFTKNGFPFDVNLSVSILDTATNDSIDGFDLHLLNAPPVDGNGKVINRSESREVVEISQATLDNLKQTDRLVLRARLQTPQNGQQSVGLFTDNDLEVKIAARLSLNVKL